MYLELQKCRQALDLVMMIGKLIQLQMCNSNKIILS